MFYLNFLPDFLLGNNFFCSFPFFSLKIFLFHIQKFNSSFFFFFKQKHCLTQFPYFNGCVVINTTALQTSISGPTQILPVFPVTSFKTKWCSSQFYIAFSCHGFWFPSVFWHSSQSLTSWLWHLWKIQTSYFVKCSSAWVCLIFSPDWI